MSAIILLIVVLAAGYIEATERHKRIRRRDSFFSILKFSILIFGRLEPSLTLFAGKADVLFLADGSDSICGGPEVCSKWHAILQLIHDVVHYWKIGPNDMKVALITASDFDKLEWYLNGYPNKTELLSAIDNVPFPGGELKKREDYVAIQHSDVFSKPKGDRPDAPNVVVMIIDGVLNLNPAARNAVSTALARKRRQTFCVCILPGCSENMARSVASPTKEINQTYFLVDYPYSFDGIAEVLAEQICSIQNDV